MTDRIPDDVKAGIQVLRDIGASDIADGIEADWRRSFWEHPEKLEDCRPHALAEGEWRVPICVVCGKRWPCEGSKA